MNPQSLPLHTQQTYAYTTAEISSEGFEAIRNFVCSQFYNADTGWEHYPMLPDDFSRDWVLVRGEYSGTFPKRVSAWLFKTYNIRASKEFLSALGNMSKSHTSKMTNYVYDFDDTFDWHDGAFGDSGSCYWGDHSGAIDMLRNEHARAVRFYTDTIAHGKGYARAWIVPITNAKCYKGSGRARDGLQNIAVIYNAYGIELLRVARLLATVSGESYKRVTLECNGETNGMLWINHNEPRNSNNSGTHNGTDGYGYAIGPAELIENLTYVDLQWGECESYGSCDSCGRALEEDNSYAPDGDDDVYCESCYHDRYTNCAYCEREMYIEDNDGQEVHGALWCARCVDRHAFQCDGCDNWYSDEEQTAVSNRYGYETYACADCLRENYTQCEDCQDYFHDTTIEEIDNRSYCADCAENNATRDEQAKQLSNNVASVPIDLTAQPYLFQEETN